MKCLNDIKDQWIQSGQETVIFMYAQIAMLNDLLKERELNARPYGIAQ
jgi:hypothetical protein